MEQGSHSATATEMAVRSFSSRLDFCGYGAACALWIALGRWQVTWYWEKPVWLDHSRRHLLADQACVSELQLVVTLSLLLTLVLAHRVCMVSSLMLQVRLVW